MPLAPEQKVIVMVMIATIANSIVSSQNANMKQLLTELNMLIELQNENEIVRNPRVARPKANGFWSEVFPYLGDDNQKYDFKTQFRIKRSTFDRLIETLSSHNNYQPSAYHRQTPLEFQIAVVLNRLANPMGYRQLETFLGVSQGSIFNFTRRFLNAVLDTLKPIITWPTGDKLDAVIEGFAPAEFRKRLPNVIGAVDGSHIPIKRPRTVYHNRYINRKNFHSIVLMAIVDNTERFTYIYSGQPGSMHDARVLKQSSFWRGVSHNPGRYFPNDTHILGDSTFPLMPWLLTPYKETAGGRLTQAQKIYNKSLLSARMTVERAFGKLKSRWRILKQAMDVDNLETAVDIIDVCCTISVLTVMTCGMAIWKIIIYLEMRH
ncbi:8878_t:CDS:2 [Paraglomus occultum]|uniref:8878_t:CDS:1 n=1 Tax=Paraglomus occultum TaxID=144539 RepID=A0A9N9DNA0_9GLOM|nr:8878_t:CDS:2 [Paraglomus occultum]